MSADTHLRRRESRIGIAAVVGFIATIFAANWLIENVGFVTIAGLTAPAGVFAAGLALVFRDVVQMTLGRWPTVAAILVGALLSALVSPAFAAASAVAFLCSELADMAVYTPLERRTLAGAMLLSNTVGAIVDSALFLWIAFGSLEFLAGQVVFKIAVTIPAVALVVLAVRPKLRTV